MQTLAILLVIIAASLTPFYLHALNRFHRILKIERPDLADHRGSLSFFYSGMPRLADPNVGVAVIRAAFGPVAAQLRAPDAMRYARRIRFCLGLGLPMYVAAFAILLIGAA
jgi:hypothetical protein